MTLKLNIENGISYGLTCTKIGVISLIEPFVDRVPLPNGNPDSHYH